MYSLEREGYICGYDDDMVTYYAQGMFYACKIIFYPFITFAYLCHKSFGCLKNMYVFTVSNAFDKS